MDFVKWYTVVYWVVLIWAGLACHGEPREGNFDFRQTFAFLLMSLPIIGRIYGWW